MAGHSSWRVTASCITGAVPEEAERADDIHHRAAGGHAHRPIRPEAAKPVAHAAAERPGDRGEALLQVATLACGPL